MKQNEKKRNRFDFWMSGDGMIRREHNIDVVKEMIQSGLTYEEIIKRARKKFRSRTIDEYYSIALDEVRDGIEDNEESETPFGDWVKRGKEQQKTEEKGLQ